MPKFEGSLKVLAVSAIHQHPDNIREELGDLSQLSADIKAMGLISPVVVYPHPDRAGDYIVQDGNRRRAASVIAGLVEIPCVVIPEPSRGSKADIETMLTTGRNHRLLSEAEVSKGVQMLLDLGMDVTTVGKKFKMSRKEIQARAKVSKGDDGVSKAYSAGRLRLDAVQKLQDLQERSEVPGLYERVVDKIESMPNGASVESVERTIAETEISIKAEERKAQLNTLNAVDGGYDLVHSSSWAVVEEEMSDAEHVAAKHRYYFGYRTAEPQWYAKQKKAKPELTQAEKQAVMTEQKLNSMLPIVKRSRLAFIEEALSSVKPDEQFAKEAISRQILRNFKYEEDKQNVFGQVIGFPCPNDGEMPELTNKRDAWRAELETKILPKLTLSALGRLLEFSHLMGAETDLGKLKGFERSPWEGGSYTGAWTKNLAYYKFLQDQLGYELDLDEVEAMQHQAVKEPRRSVALDLVEVPDEVTSTCQGCNQVVVADSEWAGKCEDCTGQEEEDNDAN